MDSNEEFEHYRYIAEEKQKPLRVDKFLLNFVEFATRSKIQQAIKLGSVRVNDHIVKANYKVKPRDVVTVVYDFPVQEIELIPENIKLEINYEDNDFLIVNKKAGMVVHPGFGNHTGTLVNALIYHFNNLPDLENKNRPGLVHRIDKNTSGLLVIAKNDTSMRILSKKFADRDLQRTYIALVWGDVKLDQGTIIGNIGRSLKNRKVMQVYPSGEYGKKAITHYKVLERFGYVTLIECKLETGRTHQIRVHLKFIGHTLFNDFEYGGNKILKGTTFSKYKQFIDNCFNICNRQVLHAKSLGFKHPTNKKDVFFDSDLPEDIQKLLDKWRKYAIHQKH